MVNQSYIKLLNAIGAFSQEHLQIKKFAADFPAQIPNFGNKDEEYPILFVSPSNSIFNLNTKTFDLTVYCFDLIQSDRENINTILSDTNSILNDLVIWLQHSEIEGIDLINSPSLTPLNNSLLDYAAGWQMNITLEVNMYTTCEIPFLNYPIVSGISTSTVYDRLLTCESLPDCPVIQDIQDTLEEIILSGGSVNINGVQQQTVNNIPFRTAMADTGVLDFGYGISANTSTTIKISPITGYIVDNETNPAIPTYQYIDYAGTSAITVTTLSSGTESFVMLNMSGITFQNTFPTSAERKTKIWLGKVAHPNGTITVVPNEPDYITSPQAFSRDLFQALGPYINDGVYPYANGANLNVNITNGNIHGNGINLHNSKTTPNEVQMGPLTPMSFFYRTQTGGTSGMVTAINPAVYDVNGVITSIGGGANNSTIQYIFAIPSQGFIIQYGQTIYSTLALAIANIGREILTVYPNLVDNSVLIGVLAINRTATALNDTTKAQFFKADKLGQIIGAAGGVSTTSLQIAYDNSLQPQITTSTALGAVSIKRGSALDTNNVFTIQNGAGTNTFTVDGNGKLTTTADALINGLTVGRGGGNISTNTALGNQVGVVNTTGTDWTGVGYRAGFNNISGNSWNAIGTLAGTNNTIGSAWNAIGYGAGTNNISGNFWVAIGYVAGLNNVSGSDWNAVGNQAARFLANGSSPATAFTNSTYIGNLTKVSTNGVTNENVFGYSTIGIGSNSVVLGNDSITKTALKGNILIGTTTDNGLDKLQVNGSVLTNQLKYTRSINISGTDLNDLEIAGFYEGFTLANAPTTGYMWVEVQRYSATNEWVNQRVTTFGSANVPNKIYSRVKNSSVWGTWRELLTTTTTGNTSNAILNQTATTQTGGFNVSSDSKINGLTVGLGGGNISTNTALGFQAGFSNTIGSGWNAVGYQAGSNNTIGNNWNAVGYHAGRVNVSGNSWNAVGYAAGFSNTIGSFWNAVGLGAGYNNISGNSWNAVGYAAGYSNITGGLWNAVGYEAGYSNTTGSFWNAVGYQAGRSNTTGDLWNAVGYRAGNSNTTGIQWNAVGPLAGNNNTTGSFWTAIGYAAGQLNTVGGSWNAIGYQAGLNNISGSSWTAVGLQAARFLADGSSPATAFTNSTYIGNETKVSANGVINENVFGFSTIGIGSNSVVLGNDSVTKTALKGNVLIGTTTDFGIGKLQVIGNAFVNGIFDVRRTGLNLTTSYLTEGQHDVNFRLGFRNGSGSTINSEQGVLVFDYIGTSIARLGFNRGSGAQADAVTLGLNNGEAFRVSGVNNLLVGTQTDTGGKLQVSGTTNLIGQTNVTTNLAVGLITNNNAARIVINGSTAGREWQLANNWNVGDGFEITPSTAISGTVFTTPAFIIKGSTSNVLIGTTTDNGLDKLQVNGTVVSTQYKVTALNTPPASSGATGTVGEIRYGSDYIYVCVATNTWKRSQLLSW